jgi:hypothetical protein
MATSFQTDSNNGVVRLDVNADAAVQGAALAKAMYADVSAASRQSRSKIADFCEILAIQTEKKRTADDEILAVTKSLLQLVQAPAAEDVSPQPRSSSRRADIGGLKDGSAEAGLLSGLSMGEQSVLD